MTTPPLPRPLAAIITALAASLSAPAALAATASASIGAVQLHVVDLDPHDGITSSLTFWNGVTTDVSASSYDFTTNTLHALSQSKPGWLSPEFVADQSPFGSAQASVGSKRLRTSGSAFDGGSFSAIASSSQSQEGAALFTLSPHTQVVISFSASVAASIFNQCGSFNCEYAQATASLSGVFFSNNGQSSQDIAGSLSAALSASGAPDGSFQSQAQSQKFTFTLTNNYDTPAALYNFWMGTQVLGFGGVAHDSAQTLSALSSVSAVPEPATPLLMLAGLAALGLARRRRSGQRSSGCCAPAP